LWLQVRTHLDALAGDVERIAVVLSQFATRRRPGSST
jgi:hypothetical protein